jgi:hypothetical protein
MSLAADVRPTSRASPSTCRKIKYASRSDTSGSCPTGDHRWSLTQARLLAPHTLAHGVDATHRSPSCCRRSVGGSGNYGNRFYAAVLSPGPRPVVARARYLVMLVAIDQMTSARMPGR